MMISLRPATSADDLHAVAPASFNSATGSGRTSYTATLNPAFNSRRAIGLPMMPTPITPTFVMRSPPLFDLDICFARDAAPFLDFRDEHAPEFGAARGGRHRAIGSEALRGFRLPENLADLGVQSRDDGSRQSHRSDHAPPNAHLVARRPGLRNCWHLRQQRRA